MKLSTDLLPTYFTIAMPNNSHYIVATNCFNFVDRGADILTVTVGDSWTWGSDLDPTQRLDQVYGNLVSTALDSDWLNLSQPGTNNFFIAERVEELGQIIPQLHYKKIYLICTFTETGRSFNSHHDVYIDYVSWFKENDIENFLAFLNAECMQRIQKVADQHNMILRTGTNFVDPVGITVDFVSWFRLLGITCNISACVGRTGLKRLQDVEQFTDNRVSYINWFNKIFDLSLHVDNICSSRKLVKQHPTAAGHEIWAKCIVESLK
jgi:hypothetical protein